MRYQLELDIDAPRQCVIDQFLEADNFLKWQPDIISLEPLSGEPRAIGSTTKQIYRMGKGELEMIETIVEPNPPFEFSATYEAGSVWNLVENQFVEAGESKTKWILESDFRSRGIMGLLAFVMPGMFKKQTMRHMNLFKDFVEAESA